MAHEIAGTADASGLRVAIVVARFNDFVTERLLEGALGALRRAGASDEALTVLRVPGAFEIPAATRLAAQTGRFDAVVCLGCLIRGATPHFEYIAEAVAHGITAAAGETGVPMTFGVLTTNSAEQALERAGPGPDNKGAEAALAAVEMATLARRIAGPSTPPGPGSSTPLGTGPSAPLGTGPSTPLGTGPSAPLGTGRRE